MPPRRGGGIQDPGRRRRGGALTTASITQSTHSRAQMAHRMALRASDLQARALFVLSAAKQEAGGGGEKLSARGADRATTSGHPPSSCGAAL
jgi:hypothetical protein